MMNFAKSRRCVFLLALICVFANRSAHACLWDTDTLAEERSSAPGILELITGKFPRHSKRFYRWRIEQRKKAIQKDSKNLALYDDLAVAYDKVGEHAKAIEVMSPIVQRHPQRYEAVANLGTFYIHKGELEHGLKFIKRAIEINPDAHFGREVAQQWVVEYLLALKKSGVSRPGPLRLDGYSEDLSFEETKAVFSNHCHNFTIFMESKDVDDWHEKALLGVLGMMRFGNYNSPVLLEILAELLAAKRQQRLAARAMILASRQATEPVAKKRYEEAVFKVLSWQVMHERAGLTSLEYLNKMLKTELADAKQWFSELEADEASWIASGEDVEQRFREKYFAAPEVVSQATPLVLSDQVLWQGGLASLLCVLLIARYFRQRK